MKTFQRPLTILFLVCSFVGFSQPTITSFSPISGPIGATVTITGTNFSTTLTSNVVSFGAVNATVSAASSTSITAIVPVGTTYQYISITNLDNGLTTYSTKPFIVTFPYITPLSNCSFAWKVDFVTNDVPKMSALADINLDGKTDVIVPNQATNNVSIFRNTGTPGSVTFAPRVSFTTGIGPVFSTTGDLDGDGKADVVTAHIAGGNSTISVLRNTSTASVISFATNIELIMGGFGKTVRIIDIDLDGKPDIVGTKTDGSSSNGVSIFRNTSTVGNISFAPKVDLFVGSGAGSVGLTCGDFDGDNKPDIGVSNANVNTISIFRNTSTLGVISFAAKIDYAANASPSYMTIGDLDGDGKLDIATIGGGSFISIYKNNSSVGSILFAPKVDYGAGGGISGVSIEDLNGDGKLDLSASSGSSNNIVIYPNNSTIGNIAFSSSFMIQQSPGSFISTGDFDIDGKPDILLTNTGADRLHVYRNQIDQAAPIAGGNSPLCIGGTLALTSTTIPNAFYSWTGPNSFSSSSQNPTVSASATTLMSGNYTLVANLPSGCSKTANVVSIVVNDLPIPAGSISGLNSVCQNQNSVTYSVPAINYATSYIWTLPSGASGSSSTNSISVNYGASAISGNITVKGSNNCGVGTAASFAVNVNQVPSSAGSITGPSIVCQEDNSIQYTVPVINNATTYNWSLPNGASGSSTTNVINIDFGSSSTSGFLSVYGGNVCGDGNSSDFMITVNPKPNPPVISPVGNIIQSNIQTGNQWYDQNGIINGETSQDFTFTNNGNYYSILTIDGCSSDPSNVISITGLGVNEHYNDLIFVTPNPFKDELTINCESNGFVKYQIIDASGKIIESNDILGKSTIITKDYNNGIYFINLYSDLEVLTFKIIKY